MLRPLHREAEVRRVIVYIALVFNMALVGEAADKPAKPRKKGKSPAPLRVLKLERGFDGALALALRAQLRFGGYIQQETDQTGWHFRPIMVVAEKAGLREGREGLPIRADAEADAFKGLAARTLVLSAEGLKLHPDVQAVERANLEAIVQAAELLDKRPPGRSYDAAVALAPGYDDAVAAAMKILLSARGYNVAVIATEKGRVKGRRGLTMQAGHAYSDPPDLEAGALIIAPGLDWKKKIPAAAARERLVWLLKERRKGSALVTFGSDTALMKTVPEFKDGQFAEAGPDIEPTVTPLCQPDAGPRAAWAVDRLLTARDVLCIPNVLRFLPVPNTPDQTVDIVGEFQASAAQGKVERVYFGMPDGTPGGKHSHLICVADPFFAVRRNNLMSRSARVSHLLQLRATRSTVPAAATVSGRASS